VSAINVSLIRLHVRFRHFESDIAFPVEVGNSHPPTRSCRRSMQRIGEFIRWCRESVRLPS
jgi:hypothetical protein